MPQPVVGRTSKKIGAPLNPVVVGCRPGVDKHTSGIRSGYVGSFGSNGDDISGCVNGNPRPRVVLLPTSCDGGATLCPVTSVPPEDA